jgi:hypothetical protein
VLSCIWLYNADLVSGLPVLSPRLMTAQLLEPGAGSGGGKDTGFDVSKAGDARASLIGFPSVGKSTLLTLLTGTASEAAAFEVRTARRSPCSRAAVHVAEARLSLAALSSCL